MGITRARKEEYFTRMKEMLAQYSKLFMVTCDNVGSKQLQNIRISLRGKAEILMGKNTMMRKVLRSYLEDDPNHPFGLLADELQGNMGYVFTNGSLTDVRDVLEANKVPAPARAGAISPVDVIVPPGPTDCDPGQTAFFQTLQIATKIAKGRIEIVSPVELLKKGDKVGQSEAALLQKLNIEPFSYALVVHKIFDSGAIFTAEVLDLTDDMLASKMSAGLGGFAAICLATGYPTMASIPHSIGNAYKVLVSIAVECEDYSFEKADAYKALL